MGRDNPMKGVKPDDNIEDGYAEWGAASLR